MTETDPFATFFSTLAKNFILLIKLLHSITGPKSSVFWPLNYSNKLHFFCCATNASFMPFKDHLAIKSAIHAWITANKPAYQQQPNIRRRLIKQWPVRSE